MQLSSDEQKRQLSRESTKAIKCERALHAAAHCELVLYNTSDIFKKCCMTKKIPNNPERTLYLLIE
jgi:hypothetical protein